MTSYKTVLWLDSDMLVVDSLAPLLSRAEELRPPQSAEPGPRIGVSYDWDWWLFISQFNHEPGMGGYWSGFNSGVFLIRPGMFDNIIIMLYLVLQMWRSIYSFLTYAYSLVAYLYRVYVPVT